MTKRTYDFNGYLELRDNPISKVGVFPYLGREIKAPEPDRIYYVLRPAEELGSQETIDSFKLMPFIDEHEMLGIGATDAERKGIQGAIGEQVYFDGEYLRANIKIHSSSAISLIDSGKIQLSPGYRNSYDFTPGEYEGQRYDAVQRNIRANHLALVTEGRTGSDVAVQDHSIFTIDTRELLKMNLEQLLEAIAALSDEDKATLLSALAPNATGDENKDDEQETTDADPEEGELDDSEKAKAEAAATEAEAAAESAVEAAVEASEAATSGDEGALEAAAESLEEAEEALESAAELVDQVTMDALSKRLKRAQKRIDTADSSAALKRQVSRLKKQVATLTAAPAQTLDTGAMLKEIASRDELAGKVSQFIGTFDHAAMTLGQVASYGVKKLGISCPKGSETVALNAWMHGRTPDSKKPSSVNTTDSAIAAGDIKSKWSK